MKAYINKDAIYEFFMWDSETLEILDSGGSLPTVDVSEEFVEEYKSYLTATRNIQEKLKAYYDLSNRP